MHVNKRSLTNLLAFKKWQYVTRDTWVNYFDIFKIKV